MIASTAADGLKQLQVRSVAGWVAIMRPDPGRFASAYKGS
jgi:hypothetical protein